VECRGLAGVVQMDLECASARADSCAESTLRLRWSEHREAIGSYLPKRPSLWGLYPPYGVCRRSHRGAHREGTLSMIRPGKTLIGREFSVRYTPYVQAATESNYAVNGSAVVESSRSTIELSVFHIRELQNFPKRYSLERGS
jgi:hypothetical protein